MNRKEYVPFHNSQWMSNVVIIVSKRKKKKSFLEVKKVIFDNK